MANITKQEAIRTVAKVCIHQLSDNPCRATAEMLATLSPEAVCVVLHDVSLTLRMIFGDTSCYTIDKEQLQTEIYAAVARVVKIEFGLTVTVDEVAEELSL